MPTRRAMDCQRLEDRQPTRAQFVAQMAQVLVVTGEVDVPGQDVLDLGAAATWITQRAGGRLEPGRPAPVEPLDQGIRRPLLR